jgi:hypothetical protein
LSQQLRRLEDWVHNIQSIPHVIYAKFLSANDTQATGGHQAGPYVPKSLIFDLFPSLNDPHLTDPRCQFIVEIPSHPHVEPVRATAIWYNNKLRGGTRNETRITGWGGRKSPLLDEANTGSLAVFAFPRHAGTDADRCSLWIATTVEELDYLEEALGPVDPSRPLLVGQSKVTEPMAPRSLTLDDLPSEWRTQLPSGADLVRWVVQRTQHLRHLSPDDRLIERRDLEYEAFRLMEAEIVLPQIRQGFADVDSFIHFAHSVANRRKSRSGTSLELHLAAIFEEEGVGYDAQATTEGNKTPDFLFPSAAAYADPTFPDNRLRMLGVKTTCKDRWRQILNEADRLRHLPKHLFTLQEGISVPQYREMADERVVLVVPASLHETYPTDVQRHLLTLAQFIDETKALQGRW